MATGRRMPVGAEVVPGGVHFRVWAPKCERVEVVLDGGEHPLTREPGGYFFALVAAKAGDRYRYRLDGGDAFPDPVSRFQPEGRIRLGSRQVIRTSPSSSERLSPSTTSCSRTAMLCHAPSSRSTRARPVWATTHDACGAPLARAKERNWSPSS